MNRTISISQLRRNRFDVREKFTTRTWTDPGPTGDLESVTIDRSFTKHHVWVAFGAYQVVLNTSFWDAKGFLRFVDGGNTVGKLPLNFGNTGAIPNRPFYPGGDGQQPSLIFDQHPASPTAYSNTLTVPCYTFENLQFDNLVIESNLLKNFGIATTLFLTGFRIMSTN